MLHPCRTRGALTGVQTRKGLQIAMFATAASNSTMAVHSNYQSHPFAVGRFELRCLWRFSCRRAPAAPTGSSASTAVAVAAAARSTGWQTPASTRTPPLGLGTTGWPGERVHRAEGTGSRYRPWRSPCRATLGVVLISSPKGIRLRWWPASPRSAVERPTGRRRGDARLSGGRPPMRSNAPSSRRHSPTGPTAVGGLARSSDDGSAARSNRKYLQIFHNRQRRHSALVMHTLSEYESSRDDLQGRARRRDGLDGARSIPVARGDGLTAPAPKG